MRETTHSAANHSGPEGRSYENWHAEGDTNGGMTSPKSLPCQLAEKPESDGAGLLQLAG